LTTQSWQAFVRVAIVAVVRHLVRDDQVMLGFHDALHIVADHTRLLACRRHGAAIRVG
jgi:hypothetical protein